MAKLYELTNDFLALTDMSDEVDVTDSLEAIEGEMQDKTDSIGKLIANWDSDIDALKAHKADVDAKIRAINNRKEALKDYLRVNMEATGMKKIECPLFTVTSVVGRSVVVIDDPNALPDEVIELVVTEKPNKKLIKEKLDAGEEVVGARLERVKNSIRIK